MTPEQIVLVGRTWAQLADDTDHLGDRFYHHLFEVHPEVRAMFPADIECLRTKFVGEIGALVEVVSDLGAFLARTGELGASHAAYGVRASHYAASRQALLAALAEALADDPELAAALDSWAAVHDLVAETMMTAASAR